MAFTNSYGDATRASAYARLEFPGTYYLAFRDLPSILARHAPGRRALDFGCGAGRSTRFLRELGFEATGVDISAEMLAHARRLDPSGDYRLVADGSLHGLGRTRVDLVLSAFTFDNVPTRRKKVALFRQLGARLGPGGCIVNLVSTPEIYTHEWASFSTRPFPANHTARTGEMVQTVITDVADARPVHDVLWPDEAYRAVYASAGLEVLLAHRPLATGEEPWRWVSETEVPPWCIYVLARRAVNPRAVPCP